MTTILLARGNGYAGDTTFDDYEVLAEPLPRREDRVFGRKPDGSGGTDYGSHWMALARRRDAPRLGYVILVQHGGGRQVVAFPGIFDGGATVEHMLQMPAAILYGILYSHYYAATEADRRAREAVRQEWAEAFIEGRIRKSRPKQGLRTVTIEPRPTAADPLAA